MWFIKKIFNDIKEVIVYTFKGLKEIKISRHLKIDHNVLSVNICALLILVVGFYFSNFFSIVSSFIASVVALCITYPEESRDRKEVFNKFRYLSIIIFVFNIYLISDSWHFISERLEQIRSERNY